MPSVRVRVVQPCHIRVAPDKRAAIVTDYGACNADGLCAPGTELDAANLVDVGLADQWAKVYALMYYNGILTECYIPIHFGVDVFSRIIRTDEQRKDYTDCILYAASKRRKPRSGFF